jgi:murein L,D-transpeptidase YcbB/YkuD
MEMVMPPMAGGALANATRDGNSTMRRRTMMMLAAAAILGGIGSAAFWSERRASAPVPESEFSALMLRVDISERHVTAELNGEVHATYGVAVGTAKHPTPRGRFAIRRIIWNPSWVPPDSEWARDEKPAAPGDPNNPMGRVKMYFREPAYYLHGTNAVSSIGRAASHGCIRMRNEDIIALAKLVMKHGGEAREPGWFQRVLNRARSTREVRLSAPVPIVIES